MFVSYAQNFEDVILTRALRGVERGCYVDVGANDPVEDSVSLAFYERGWRGVHVEPVPVFAERLRAARPDELVLEAAVSPVPDRLSFFRIGETGLGTGDADVADAHRRSGFPVERIDVATVTLDDVLARAPGPDIHWLKIDVEGAEAEVLASWRGDILPWIVLVEATQPGSPLVNHERWEQHLLQRGYVFAYFDGLNRFYVGPDHRRLLNVFGPGPNVFDGFTLSGSASGPYTVALNQRLRAKDAEVQALRASLGRAEDEARRQGEVVAEQGLALRHLDRMGAVRARLLRDAIDRLEAVGSLGP